MELPNCLDTYAILKVESNKNECVVDLPLNSNNIEPPFNI